ncbi:hypothetical protein J2Z21_005249 [Streptomyces griseochromogenes]|uniref:Uncharacterized protein n=1 Tax=Streptomyces griseochromogenes TaxID=68214 RepID=A0A1B1AWF2_9ACTN|nr:methyltransferase [Streptomyces griseochromogenes]ANP50840.1 hypothetical protein AVL59_15505 [Streptomyces griseochromogenes]MBP2052267.1 hypothetical protein [Streptomyces griseochromogenes]
MSKSLSVAARLGVADALGDAPVPIGELADRIGAHPAALDSLVRVLSSFGIFAVDDQGAVSHSALSDPLRSDHPQSMRNFCILSGEMYYEAWNGLLHTVRTGESGSRHVFGRSVYDHMDENPETAEVYDRAMQELARPVAGELARHYDFSGRTQVVDVGGGIGELLKGLLSAHPHLRGLCADRDDVCARGAADLRASGNAGLAGRLRFQAADFLREVPSGGDVYLLKNVLHNWNRDNSVRILANVRRALEATERSGTHGSRRPVLLIIEPLAEDDPHSSIRSLFQMVICEEGTRERTREEMTSQVLDAGLAAGLITSLSSGHSVVECTAK